MSDRLSGGSTGVTQNGSLVIGSQAYQVMFLCTTKKYYEIELKMD